MKTNYSNPPFDYGSFLAQMARGKVPGASLFNAFGERTEAGGTAERIVWPLAATQIPIISTSGGPLVFTCSSPNDTVGGTGINSVELYYLDSSLNQFIVEVPLNGGVFSTASLTPAITDIRWPQCIHVCTVGNLRAAAGNIIGTIGGVEVTEILAGKTRCSSSVRRVPAGKRAMIGGAVGGSAAATADTSCIIRLSTSIFGDCDLSDSAALIPQGTIPVENGVATYVFPTPFPVPAGGWIAITAETNKAAFFSADWFGWLEDE